MRLALIAGAAAACLLLAGLSQQERRGREGQREPGGGVHLVEVPGSDLDVIAGAPTRDSIILSIRGKDSTKADLVVRDSTGANVKTEAVPLTAGTPVEASVTGLKPGTVYSYKLSQGSSAIEGRFSTARLPGAPFQFAIQADSHLDGNSDLGVYQRTLSNIVEDKPDFLVDLGDTFMVDKYPNPADARRQYEAQRWWFSRPGSQMSVFLCLGNHDGEVGWAERGNTETAGWARRQREALFPVIRPGAFYSGAPKKGLWYSWNWGDATFVVLDPFVATTHKPRGDEDGWTWTLGKEQFDWLSETLQKSRSKFKFVFIHHLVGGFGGAEARGGVEAADRFEWGDKNEFPAMRTGWAEPIHALMVKHRVTALFHGHDHLYVRQEKDGIVYLEVPQPSHSRGDATGSAAKYGYASGVLLGSSGHIRVSVSPKECRLEYVKSKPGSDNRAIVDSMVVEAGK